MTFSVTCHFCQIVFHINFRFTHQIIKTAIMLFETEIVRRTRVNPREVGRGIILHLTDVAVTLDSSVSVEGLARDSQLSFLGSAHFPRSSTFSVFIITSC